MIKAWFKKIWLLVLVRFKPKDRQPIADVKFDDQFVRIDTDKTPEDCDVFAGDSIPPPQPNRKVRRQISALERARRKHDKFVTPQGTPPVHKQHIERTASSSIEPKPPEEPAPQIKTAEFYCVDKHHEGGENVIYRETEFYGEYNFRDTILEQLDRYFVYLNRMKKNDPGAYELYKRVGAILLPYVDIHPDLATAKPDRKRRKPITTMPKLSGWFKQTRPAFGCFVYGANPLAEKNELEHSEEERQKNTGKWITVPKFMYFNKYSKPPPEIQPMSGGDIYCMSIWWDRPHDPTFKRKQGGPTEYAVFVSSDGEHMEILRMVKTRMIQVAKKKHKKDSHGNISLHFDIPQRSWQIPKIFRDWADDFHEDVQIHLADIFVEAMLRYEQAQYSMVRISAKKNDMTAIFSVNIRRMAYFFKDRDYVLNENGARRPVFHMVRAHERETIHGKHAVKFHFRGDREFTWAGYQISITVPGRDHFMLTEFDIGTVDEYWIDKKDMKNYLDPAQTGDKINEWIKAGVGGKRPT